MIAAVLLALQLADSTGAVRVANGSRSARVPIVYTRAGPIVAAGEVAAVLGVEIKRVEPDRFNFVSGATTIELTLGLPFARVGKEAAPLLAAPVERGGKLFVPLTLVTDVLPTYVADISYNRTSVLVTRRAATTAPAAGARASTTGPPPASRSGSPPSTVKAPAARASASARPASSKSPAATDASRRQLTVVVDAGHGGRDRGMSGPVGAAHPIDEKDVTLAVAKRLRDALRSRGVRVLMTRSTDTLIALGDRGKIANEAGAQLFISIHVNAANPHWKNPAAARGFETYFLADAKTEDEKRVEEMENDASRYDLGGDIKPGDPLSFVVSDMIQNEHLRESSELAATIQAGLHGMHPGTDRGVKQAGFVVLVTAHMPAVLVEVGFGTNARDAAYMSSAKGQEALAESIAKSTMGYLAEYERRTGTPLPESP
jgi:N-acetylmuramoyl-L-alanine amidase